MVRLGFQAQGLHVVEILGSLSIGTRQDFQCQRAAQPRPSPFLPPEGGGGRSPIVLAMTPWSTRSAGSLPPPP